MSNNSKQNSTEYLQNCLKSTDFLDFDIQEVQDFAHKNTKETQTNTEKAISLYLAVRDGFFYNPYHLDLTRTGLKASSLLKRNHGYCIEKAVLLASVARFVGIPSRLFFGNVRNHIATEKLETILKTNLLVFHGSTELFLEGKWVKVTPAFNKALCEKLGVATLEFNGVDDSLFQQYSNNGAQFMEYLEEYGSFEDMPFDLFITELKNHYKHLIDGKEINIEGFFVRFEATNV